MFLRLILSQLKSSLSNTRGFGSFLYAKFATVAIPARNRRRSRKFLEFKKSIIALIININSFSFLSASDSSSFVPLTLSIQFQIITLKPKPKGFLRKPLETGSRSISSLPFSGRHLYLYFHSRLQQIWCRQNSFYDLFLMIKGRTSKMAI